MSQIVNKGLERAVVQSKYMAESLWNEKDKLPRTIGKDGKFVTSTSRWWTSGFFQAYYGIYMK